MFIYSMRASTLKFFGVTTAALIALVTLLFFIPSAIPEAAPTSGVDVSETVKFDKIKTADDRLNFLRSFGWEVEAKPIEEVEVTIPADFDKVFQSYNELQKKQGFDLSKYHKKNVMRYTYRVTNYPGYDGEVWVSILMSRNKVIGGDVSSADANGFIHGLDPKITY